MEHIVTVLVSCGAATKSFGGGGGGELGEKLPPPPPPRLPHWIEPCIDVQIDIKSCSKKKGAELAVVRNNYVQGRTDPLN